MLISFKNESNRNQYLHISFCILTISSVTESLFHAMEGTIFNMTLNCTMIIAFNLCAIEFSGGPSIGICIAFMNMCTICSLTFSYFYLSECITTDLMAIGDAFYNSMWYDRFTSMQQKRLVLAIQRAQHQVRLTGLGLFDCSLPVFSAVCT